MHVSTTGTANGLVLRVREQIAEARNRIERINNALFDKTGNRFEDTLDAVNADDVRNYWETKLIELQELLENYSTSAVVVQSDEIVIGDIIELQRISDKSRFQFRLVDRVDLFPEERCISVESPLGRAILGKQQGDKVSVETPMGEQEYYISDRMAGAGN